MTTKPEPISDCPHPKPCLNPWCYLSDKALMEEFRDEMWQEYLAGDKGAYDAYLATKGAVENWGETP